MKEKEGWAYLHIYTLLILRKKARCNINLLMICSLCLLCMIHYFALSCQLIAIKMHVEKYWASHACCKQRHDTFKLIWMVSKNGFNLIDVETRQRANSFSVKVFNCTFALYKMDGKIYSTSPSNLVNKYLHLNSIKLFNKSVILSPSWYTSITIIPWILETSS